MPDQIYGVTWNGAEKVSYTYDPLGRLTNRKIGSFSNAYTFEDVGEDKTTTLVQSVVTPAGTYSYTYDNIGNILSITDGTYTATYAYDSLNQLVRANDARAGKTYTYSYSNGNITEKKEYAYTTGELGEVLETKNWTYGDSVWSDLLTDFNGTAITYDEVGNPLTIGSKELSWLGRQLTQITDGEEKISYAYNGDGQRVSKTVNGTTTQFAYLGGRLMAQKTGEDVIFFQYGAGGVPLGFVYNGVQYFYVTNQLGDIIGITDATGDAFVMYSYDEWGNPIQTITRDNTAEQNKIAEINPLRYRGYYYDTETGYYYLQSRYYNPKWGRFISPDNFGYIDNSTRLGFNAYIYCINNPVMFTDPTGTEKEVISTPQGDAVVQIIFSTIFIDGIINFVQKTSQALYNALVYLVDRSAELVGKLFLMIESTVSLIWDELIVHGFETVTLNFTNFISTAIQYFLGNTVEYKQTLEKLNPLVSISSFILNTINTVKDMLYTAFQKVALILTDAIGTFLPYFIPGLSIGGSLGIDFVSQILQLIMKSGFLISNGNVLH